MADDFVLDQEAHAADVAAKAEAEKADATEDKSEDESIISDTDPDDKADATEDSDDTDDSDDDKSEDDDEEKDERSDEQKAFDEGQVKWTKEFTDTGELSADTRKEISESVFKDGVPQEIKDGYIDGYVKGNIAMGAQEIAAAYAVVGGQEEYAKMSAWVAKNLSEEETATVNADVLGSDIARRDAALQGLHARMQQDVGHQPDDEPNLSHDGGPGGGEPIISSRQELAKIMGTEAYKTDPAVRAKVERQLRQSRATGKYTTS